MQFLIEISLYKRSQRATQETHFPEKSHINKLDPMQKSVTGDHLHFGCLAPWFDGSHRNQNEFGSV